MLSVCKNAVLVIAMSVVLAGCLGMPEKVQPVTGFDLNRYLGQWYEIARLDHSFERGLTKVTAHYALREDGGVAVTNKGYEEKEGKWKEAEGKAYFVESSNQGYLKVSFFGPFYGSYVIFELDKEGYQYAFISGPDLSYLWLLARTPTVPKQVIDQFKQQASQAGFDVSKLIMVSH